MKVFVSESKRSDWDLTTSGKSIFLGNIRDRRKTISVFKNKGVGHNEFYLMFNNQPVELSTLDDLKQFIDEKYEDDSVPDSVWNNFVKKLPNYK